MDAMIAFALETWPLKVCGKEAVFGGSRGNPFQVLTLIDTGKERVLFGVHPCDARTFQGYPGL